MGNIGQGREWPFSLLEDFLPRNTKSPLGRLFLDPLISGLISYWRLEESSGTRVDSFGPNDLIEQNSVTSTTGKIGNAANFVAANSENLSISDATQVGLSFSGSFTFGTWVRLTTKTATQILISKNNALPNAEYSLFYSVGLDRFGFQLFDAAPAPFPFVLADNFGSPSTGVLHYIVFWYDSSALTINIQVNGGAVDSLAFPNPLVNGTSPFFIGSDGPASVPISFTDGDIDEVTVWGRVLPAAERTRLFGGGNGINLNNLL